MRRLVIFLAVLAIGLVVLLWVERRAAKERLGEVPIDQATPPPIEETPFTEAQVPGQTSTGEQQKIEFALDGRFEHTERRPTGEPRYLVRAVDVDALGEDRYDLNRFHSEFFLPGETEAWMELDAVVARAKLRGDPVGLDEVTPITMRDVDARILRGLPLTPLRMRVPALEGTLGMERLQSDLPVEIVGSGLVAHGAGVDAELAQERLALLRDTRVELDLEGGGRATLTSRAGVEMRRAPGVPDLGSDPVEIEALGSAVLVLDQEERISLAGERLVLHGDWAPGEPRRFRPRLANVTQDVRLVATQGTFEGQRGVLEFDATGLPLRARLEEDPRLTLWLEGEAKEALSGAGEKLEVRARGQGPLTLALRPAETFDFAGPAVVTLPELEMELNAGGGLRGRTDITGAFRTLFAHGGVEARRADGTLSTSELDLASITAVAAQPILRMSTRARATSTGRLVDGREYKLVSGGGLDVLRTPRGFRVPRADQVELEVLGEQGFTATADILRNFDAQTLAYEARGNVVLVDQRVTARGDELDALPNASWELRGTPARLERSEGLLTGRFMEWDGTRLAVRDEVQADVLLGGRRIEVQSNWLVLERGMPLETDPVENDLVLDAGSDVLATITEGLVRYELRAPRMRAIGSTLGADPTSPVDPRELFAAGGVRLDYQAALSFTAWGQRFQVDAEGVGRLEPREGEAVLVNGVLPKDELRFEMRCSRLDFTSDRLEAKNVDVSLFGLGMPLSSAPIEDPTRTTRAIAGRMIADKSSILFAESVNITGAASDERGWSVDSAQALFTEPPPLADESFAAGRPLAFTAWGDCRAQFAGEVDARGHVLRVDRVRASAVLEGKPAKVDSESASWTADRFEWNLESNFVHATPGILRSLPLDAPKAWSLTYTSLEQVEGPDATVQVVREPVLVQDGETLRAAWMLLWVDRREWSKLAGRFFGAASIESQALAIPPRIPTTKARPQSLFALLDRSGGFGKLIDELYVEGNAEHLIGNKRAERFEAMYLDLADGHGWLRDVELSMPIPFLEDRDLTMHTEWLQHSADGTARAENVLTTSCDFAEPDYQIKSRDLRIRPNPEKPGWILELSQNALVFGNGFQLPLPRAVLPYKPNFELEKDQASIGGFRFLSIGNKARFGTFIGTEIGFELGAIGRGLDRLLGGDALTLHGDSTFRPAFLNKRGLLLGLETKLTQPDLYRLTLDVDGIVDTGEDRGLVRVDEADRSNLRAWYHLRGRYFMSEDQKTWLDFVATHQTDAGVQSEFFEGAFLRFEERESFVHWRKGWDGSLLAVTAEERLDDFRSEVMDAPSGRLFHGRSELARLGTVSLVYSSDTTAGRLVREEGDLRWDKPFADGLGNRDVLRVDSRQRLEVSQPVGFGGLIATPWFEGRASAWDQGVDPADQPWRAALLAGLDLSTAFWRRYEGGTFHEITPLVTLRGDLVSESRDGQPVHFDLIEDPLEGRFVDLSLRSRWEQRGETSEERTFLDLAFRQTHAEDVSVGVTEGWMPFEFNAQWLTTMFSVPIGFTQDTRYAFQDGQTIYSRSSLGLLPMDSLDVSIGYNSADDDAGGRLFEALTVGARYALSSKWEVEGQQVISQRGGRDRLSWSGTLRRFGHDFVFELGLSFVAGEGASSFEIKFLPNILWKPSDRHLVLKLREDD